jgi:heavy metal translocating P-type ATPase
MSTTNELFEEFFANQEEFKSPFLKRRGRSLSKNISLKAALVSTVFLILSFAFSFTHEPLANFMLLFVYFFAGIPALIESIEDLKKLTINIDVLMILAAFLSIFIDSALEGGLLLVLFAISGAMEDAALSKTTSAIKSLHKLTPKTAIVLEDGKQIVKSIKEIEIDSIILVKPGQIVPLDGVVTNGATSLNLSHLTGENMPITIQVGDVVPAGGQNIEGVIEIKVSTKSHASTLSKIIELVTKAQNTKPQVQRLLDKVGPKYATSIILLAFLFAITLPFFAVDTFLGSEGSIYRALAFLIAASPCALIIATPTAYLSSLSSCARKGVLLKGGFVLDGIAETKNIAFDKTGTLTKSELTLDRLEMIEDGIDEAQLLAVAYSLELNSTHPIGLSVCKYAVQNNIKKLEVQDLKEIPGLGLEAKVKIGNVFEQTLIGHSKHIIPRLDPKIKEKAQAKIEAVLNEGKSYCILSVKGALCILTFFDTIRTDAKAMIATLKNEKMNVWMLTGDHEATAKRIGRELSIEHIQYDLKPDQKLELISQLNAQGGTMMIGDGINDGPALANAKVGITLGSIGSDTAIEASDVVILNDELKLLPWLIKKAKKTKQIVTENLIFATMVIIGTSFAALFGIVPLWMAVVLHEGGTILVAFNGLRLIRT